MQHVTLFKIININAKKEKKMEYALPKIGKKPINFPYFPTRQQAFIFRAAEYIPFDKIAHILKTDVHTVIKAAADMGLPNYDPGDIWLKKGMITIVRRLWHILPYEQLIQLLETTPQEFARILREEDFLDIKLDDKPDCEPLYWHELSDAEQAQTAKIRQIMEHLCLEGVPPFDFHYDVPQLSFSGSPQFQSRIIYGFSGQYLHAFDMDSRDYCPDEMLEAYQKIGINGIWTQGVLNQLAPFPFDPSLSVGYERRIQRMQDFAKRLKKYGIKLYLYLNEPRALPASFFAKHPELRGHQAEDDKICLCTSLPQVQEYLSQAVASICRAVPDIGGFFTITRSENYTNCYSHAKNSAECTCPRCKHRTVSDVVAETISCIAQGAHSVCSDIPVMAWSWRWEEFHLDIIKKLPKDVILLSQSELAIPFTIGGVTGEVLDYSMSIPGPGERAKQEWTLAKKCGLETGAKMQLNTSWECSTIPALPVFPSIEKHIQDVAQEGVSHLLLSWTLGGYPSRSIAHAAQYFYANCTEIPESPIIKMATEQFANAFKEYPFHIDTLYFGPQNAGVANPLYLEPTGYKASMTCYAYDDVDTWRGIYPVDIYEEQYRKLCEKWKQGLLLLASEPACETTQMAQGAYCMFRSSYNQIRFYRARKIMDSKQMHTIAQEEKQLALHLLDLMNQNAAIGFEAANHYYFSKGELAEKIINCTYVIDTLS